jgi:hypothetical protein
MILRFYLSDYPRCQCCGAELASVMATMCGPCWYKERDAAKARRIEEAEEKHGYMTREDREAIERGDRLFPDGSVIMDEHRRYVKDRRIEQADEKRDD